MKRDDDIAKIKRKLLPVLRQTSIGDYSQDIELTKGDPMNDVYVGIQILINTIREQTADLESVDKKFHDYWRRNTALNRLCS